MFIGKNLFFQTKKNSHISSILLENVQTLTFEQGKYTTGRRSSPIPQLNCLKNCEHTPPAIQCYNRGLSDRDVQWQCETQLRSGLELGNFVVSCEGFSHPDDPYVLIGSCGIEYNLLGSPNHVTQVPKDTIVKNRPTRYFRNLTIFVLFVISIIWLFFYYSTKSLIPQNNSTQQNHYTGSFLSIEKDKQDKQLDERLYPNVKNQDSGDDKQHIM